jgi:23S rRNA (uracil1939-C5)-methyltransferase
VTKAPQQPNLLDLEIRDLSNEGDGIGQSDGRIVFVDGALPGERVEVRLTAASRGRMRGELRQLLQASPQRRRPPCILAEDCGGCSLQHWQDSAQSSWKQDHLQQVLQRIGNITKPLAPILIAPQPLGYRNRAIIPLQAGSNGLKAGFYRRRTHTVVNMNHCPVLDPRLDKLIAPIKRDLIASEWPAYNEENRSGLLRHLVLRLGVSSGELLIGLVSTDKRLAGLTELAEQWLARWPNLVGVVLNLQPKPVNSVFGENALLIGGRPWLLERFGDRSFQIGLDTFFQVNTSQAERLLPLLRQALQLKPGQLLVDAYCGVGTLGLPLLAEGIRLIGIEQHPASVERAQSNAKLNGLEQAEFLLGDVDLRLQEVLPFADALLLDPPRKGLLDPVCAAIVAQPPARIAYVSCNPATLARDLARLTASGELRLESVQALDFFPQTTHIEALAVLVNRAVQP